MVQLQFEGRLLAATGGRPDLHQVVIHHEPQLVVPARRSLRPHLQEGPEGRIVVSEPQSAALVAELAVLHAHLRVRQRQIASSPPDGDRPIPVEVEHELPHLVVALVGVGEDEVGRVDQRLAEDGISVALVVHDPVDGRAAEVAAQLILPVLEAVSRPLLGARSHPAPQAAVVDELD